MLRLGDGRSRLARSASQSLIASSGLLPSEQHTLIGYTCKDCQTRTLYPTVHALLSHCGRALREGLHRSSVSSAGGPLGRKDPIYKMQHQHNLLAVVNYAPDREGGRDDPRTRTFIPVDVRGAPVRQVQPEPEVEQDAEHGRAAAQLAEAERNPARDQDSNIDSDNHSEGGGNEVVEDNEVEDSRDEGHHHVLHHEAHDVPQIVSPNPARPAQHERNDGEGQSYAGALIRNPQFTLREALEEGIEKIQYGVSHDETLTGWRNMNAKLQALRSHGLDKIRHEPQLR